MAMLLLALLGCWISDLRDPPVCDSGQHQVDSACVDDVPPVVIPGNPDDSQDSPVDSE